MIMIEALKKKQQHNHKILDEVTILEQAAFEAIGEPEKFEKIIKKIDLLQSQYKT